MKRRWIIFGLVALAALAIPIWMIVTQERVLAQGSVYKFQVRPVDPYDPFRGRYMALDFTEDKAPAPGVPLDRFYRQELFGKVVTGEDGFADIESLSVKPPAEGDYVKVRSWGYRDEGKVRFDLPFDRYYLREDMAPKAEELLSERLRPPEPEINKDDEGKLDVSPEALERWNEQRNAPVPGVYVTVRVLDGRAALEELWVDGQPILEYISEHEGDDGEE